MRCQFIKQASAEFPVRSLCQVCAVSPVSYYRSLKTKSLVSSDADLATATKDVFWRHSRRYGSRRIAAELQAEGHRSGRHKVRRLMREQGLRAIQPKSFVPRTTDSRHTLGYSANLLLAEKVPPDKPRQVLVGDITYLPLVDGRFAYLATWMDLCSRKIVGWAVADHMEERLIIEAFARVVRRHKLPAGVIVHSDRGGQYAGKRFRRLLHEHGLRQSMSRAGESYDNAFAESLFSRYKAELLEGGAFASVEEARLETFGYIEGYYNRIRRHSSLGYLSPEEYELKFVSERDEQVAEVLDSKPMKGLKAKQYSCNTF